MPPSSEGSAARPKRELAHDRTVAGNAELIWNWASPSGRRRAARRAGFFEPYDSLHPLVPAPLVGAVARLSVWLERVPLLREIAGSQLLRARKP